MGTVDTNQNYYKPFGIKYKGLKLLDVAQTNISMYFNEVAEFIDDALRGGGEIHLSQIETVRNAIHYGQLLVFRASFGQLPNGNVSLEHMCDRLFDVEAEHDGRASINRSSTTSRCSSQ